jgi:hypothetical protein
MSFNDILIVLINYRLSFWLYKTNLYPLKVISLSFNQKYEF